MTKNKPEWYTYEIHELNVGKFKWRVLDKTPKFERDYWDFETLGEAEKWCKEFTPTMTNVRGSKYTIYYLDGREIRGRAVDNPHYVCKHESTYVDNPYMSSNWYVMCGICEKAVSGMGHFNLKDANLEEQNYHLGIEKPAECKDGCPENQTCDACAGTTPPVSCKCYLNAEPEKEKEGEDTDTLDVYLLVCYDVDGKLVVLEGSSDLDVLKDNYLEPDGDEWIVKVKMPLQKMKDSEPAPLPVVEIN